MVRYENRVVRNRRSPSNENAYRDAYKCLNPSARRRDNYDISAVRAKDGTLGHALLPESINRSKDRDNHIGKSFIPDYKLRKQMKK